MTNEVVGFDKDRRAIAEARAVEDVRLIRDKMAAMVAFYKSERDPELARKAAELKLLAEARIGEMSLTLKSNQGARTDKINFVGGADEVSGKQETLKSVGISKQDASTFERLARLPKDKLAQAARECKSARSIVRAKPSCATPGGLQGAGRTSKEEIIRPAEDDGGSASGAAEDPGARNVVPEPQMDVAALQAELEALRAENERLKGELDAHRAAKDGLGRGVDEADVSNLLRQMSRIRGVLAARPALDVSILHETAEANVETSLRDWYSTPMNSFSATTTSACWPSPGHRRRSGTGHARERSRSRQGAAVDLKMMIKTKRGWTRRG